MTPDFHVSRWMRLRAALQAPRDIAALAAFRVAFGLIACASAVRFIAYGWVDQLFVRPGFHFSYWGFGWLPRPSEGVTYALFAVMALLGLLVAAGLFYRVSVALLFLVFTYLQLVDVANYLNHYYLVSLLAGLLLFIPAHRRFSLDAWRRPALRCEVLPAWCTYLLRFQVAVVYINAGLAKATGDWLLHAQPLNIWLSARGGLPILGPYLDSPAIAYVAAWAGFLFDTTVVAFLLWRRTRLVAYLAVLGFHLMTHLLFPSIGMFPIIMVVAALVFFDASWPRHLTGHLGGAAPRAPAPPTPVGALAEPPARHPIGLGASLACLFLMAQVLVPLRAHVYGGNVLWHEQGMRFSWRVLSRAKNGSVTFIVHDPAADRSWQVSPAKYLTMAQEREMAVQPDLILQLAHHIAREFEAKGHPGVQVRAQAVASLNGRPAQALIDPRVDLAHEADGFARKRWITEAPLNAPPHLLALRAWSL